MMCHRMFKISGSKLTKVRVALTSCLPSPTVQLPSKPEAEHMVTQTLGLSQISMSGEDRLTSPVAAETAEPPLSGVTDPSTMPLLKRMREDDTKEPELHMSKRSRLDPSITGVPATKPPPVVQAALYGVEMLSSDYTRSHSIVVVIEGLSKWLMRRRTIGSAPPADDTLQVWRYDRQGAIQSSRINFLEDLPYFLILLLAFSRFTPKDFGVMSEFSQQDETVHFASSGIQMFDAQMEPVHSLPLQLLPQSRSLSLDSRGTALVDVETSFTAAFSEYPALICKMAWTPLARASEWSHLKFAHEIAATRDGIKGHVAQPILSCNPQRYNTGAIRLRLGITPQPLRERTFWLIVSEKLSPIHQLPGAEVLRVISDCFKCKRRHS
jgi:hypothetical protein